MYIFFGCLSFHLFCIKSVMESYVFENGDCVLLVGEGNFSFTVSLLKYNEKLALDGVKVITTCFETEENLHKLTRENVDLLQGKKGVTVLYNVDATELKKHPIIGTKTFTKIIFNFPHVGGKMKIHLNRKLVKDFFRSAKDVLAENGIILLTLCDGQGGTVLDKTQRRWDDTWKVVEMAAYGDFVLSKAYLFPSNYFPEYATVGYRSQEKSFKKADAVVHEFKLHFFPLLMYNENKIEELFQYEEIVTPFEKLKLRRMYSDKVKQNYFNRENSLVTYWFNYFKQSIENMGKEIGFKFEDITLLYGDFCLHSHPRSLLEQISFGKNNSAVCFFSLRLHEVKDNFSQHPVTREIVCVGEDSSYYADHFIYKFFCYFQLLSCYENIEEKISNSRKIYIDSKGNITEFLNVIPFNENNSTGEISIILLNNLLDFVLHEKYYRIKGELCHFKDIYFSEIESWCLQGKLSPPCFSPLKYTFDLSISVPEPKSFSQEEFFVVLWTLGGDIIINVELISKYDPPDTKERRFCYRIVYKSLKEPLYRERVVHIHRNIIGRTLEKRLGVTLL